MLIPWLSQEDLEGTEKAKISRASEVLEALGVEVTEVWEVQEFTEAL